MKYKVTDTGIPFICIQKGEIYRYRFYIYICVCIYIDIYIAETAVNGTNLRMSLKRHPIVEKLEEFLLQCIKDSTKPYMTLSFLIIREKAQLLFELMTPNEMLGG